MGIGQLPLIIENLIKNGKNKNTPIAIIQWGTLMKQKTVIGTLETISKIVDRENIVNPSMIVIGEVVGLNRQLNWFNAEKNSIVSITGS